MGPRLPLAAPSTLSLKDPAGGPIQEFRLEIVTRTEREIELLEGNSPIPNSYRIILLFASVINSSCVHLCRVIVSLR